MNGRSGIQQAAGFTLIELMMVVVIASILLFIAVPAYQESVRKSNRNAARGVLMAVLSKQEQYFINNKTYADSLAKLGYTVDGNDKFYIDNKTDRYDASNNDTIYQIELVTISTVYSVNANRLTIQLEDTYCGDFNLTGTGVKSNTGPGDVLDCW